ncbi:MAG TPA: MFS transporter [Rhizomicrobium sp.]|nr:MFS transporter [Rhizomicrobium sp.]
MSDEAAGRPPGFYAGVIALIALGQVIFGTDFCAVSVALSSIAGDLHVAPALMSWVVAIYSLTYAGFLVLGGRTADSYGRRRFCLLGLYLFGAGTLIAAAAANVWMLIAGRALEGLGSAFFIPTSFSLINVLLPDGPIRHRAFAVFSATQGLAMMLGLCGGGLLTTQIGWRAAFLITVPLVVAAIILSWRFIPPFEKPEKAASLDIGGAILITLGVGVLLTSLSVMGEFGWLSSQGLETLAAACGLLLVFFVVESRVRKPLVPLSVFRHPNLLGADVASIGAMATTGGVFVLLNLFMQRELHFSAMLSGLGMLPYALAVMAAGRLVGHGMARFPLRQCILVGFVVFIVGVILFSMISPGGSYALYIAPAMIIAGLGSTVATVLLMALSTAAVPSERQGVATGVLITFQQIGMALGVSLALTVMSANLKQGAPLVQSLHGGFLAATGMAVFGFLSALLFTRKTAVSAGDLEAASAEAAL